MLPSWILQIATIVGGIAAVIGLWERISRRRQKRGEGAPPRRLPRPPLWKQLTVAIGILLPIPIIAVLAIGRASSADVSLDLSVSGASFELAMEAPLLWEPLRLSELGAFDLREIETPVEWVDGTGEPFGVLEATSLTLSAAEGGPETAIYLDDVRPPDGTAVSVLALDEPGYFRLALTKATVEPKVSVDGEIEIVVPAVLVMAYDFEPGSFRLVPSTDQITLDLTLYADSANTALSDLRIKNLELYRVDRYRQGTEPMDRMVSTVLSGTISFPYLNRSLRLADGDELWLAGTEGELDLLLVGAAIDLEYSGSVSGLRTGTAELSRSIMPRRGEVWLARYALITVPLALLYLTALYGVIRWWRKWA
jgi:hypothetical protein